MLGLLYADELRGFVKSKAMIVLLVGLPLLSILMQLLQPNTEGIPLSYFVAILVSGIGGTLGAVLLSTSITSERLRHVYDLFLVRPVRRSQLVLAKFFSALTCLVAAVVLSVGLGFLIDILRSEAAVASLAEGMLYPTVISIAGIAVACSTGILFGMLFSSVAVSAILAVYLGNQLTALIILPTVLVEGFDPLLYAIAVGIGLPTILLLAAIAVFRKKAL